MEHLCVRGGAADGGPPRGAAEEGALVSWALPTALVEGGARAGPELRWEGEEGEEGEGCVGRVRAWLESCPLPGWGSDRCPGTSEDSSSCFKGTNGLANTGGQEALSRGRKPRVLPCGEGPRRCRPWRAGTQCSSDAVGQLFLCVWW